MIKSNFRLGNIRSDVGVVLRQCLRESYIMRGLSDEWHLENVFEYFSS